MKKGISIWSFPPEELRQSFLRAKQAGFEGVEVALDAQGEIGLDSTEEDMRKLKQYASEASIELYSVASGLYWSYSYVSNDENKRNKAKEITKKQLQIAAWLGCDTILVVPGVVGSVGDGNATPYDVAYTRTLEALKELAPVAEELKVTIGVENVWNQFLLSPLEMAGLIDAVGSDYVKAYFDVGNILKFGHPEQWIDILSNRIAKIHIKDFRKEVGSGHGFVDLLSGDVNFPLVMEALERNGYDDWITAEVSPYRYYPAAVLDTASVAMDYILGRK